jgi:hypothetical protein
MMYKSESDKPTISADVAELIATGIVARGGIDLELYRTEVRLGSRGLLKVEFIWQVKFVIKERYKHFNVVCPIVEVDSKTGQVMMHSYPSCNERPVMEHATSPLRHSLPDGHSDIRVNRLQFLSSTA